MDLRLTQELSACVRRNDDVTFSPGIMLSKGALHDVARLSKSLHGLYIEGEYETLQLIFENFTCDNLSIKTVN